MLDGLSRIMSVIQVEYVRALKWHAMYIGLLCFISHHSVVAIITYYIYEYLVFNQMNDNQ